MIRQRVIVGKSKAAREVDGRFSQGEESAKHGLLGVSRTPRNTPKSATNSTNRSTWILGDLRGRRLPVAA